MCLVPHIHDACACVALPAIHTCNASANTLSTPTMQCAALQGAAVAEPHLVSENQLLGCCCCCCCHHLDINWLTEGASTVVKSLGQPVGVRPPW